MKMLAATYKQLHWQQKKNDKNFSKFILKNVSRDYDFLALQTERSQNLHIISSI